MHNAKRPLALLLVLCLLLSVLPVSAFAVQITTKPENGTTKGQPFAPGTGESRNFRIPGITTLDNGRVVATIDARWSWLADAGGIDTMVSVSDDNGANWTYTFANYLGDNGNVANNQSCCFIDPAIATDGTTPPSTMPSPAAPVSMPTAICCCAAMPRTTSPSVQAVTRTAPRMPPTATT